MLFGNLTKSKSTVGCTKFCKIESALDGHRSRPAASRWRTHIPESAIAGLRGTAAKKRDAGEWDRRLFGEEHIPETAVADQGANAAKKRDAGVCDRASKMFSVVNKFWIGSTPPTRCGGGRHL